MSDHSPQLSNEEKEQLLQTVEMFDVIVQANPLDTQSMEILRDAYRKLGRHGDASTFSRKIAEVLADQGQFSAAILEIENLIQIEVDNPELITVLGDIQERMAAANAAGGGMDVIAMPEIQMDFRSPAQESGNLIATHNTAGAGSGRGSASVESVLATDGNEPLAKFILHNKLAPEQVLLNSVERVRRVNSRLAEGTPAHCLMQELVASGGVDLETLLAGIVERTKFAYIPLEYYDFDRQVVRLLPDSLTLQRLIVPFDLMSRTLMVATVNPFDSAAKELVQQTVDYNIQWHVTSPGGIYRVLRDAYRIQVPEGAIPGKKNDAPEESKIVVENMENKPQPAAPTQDHKMAAAAVVNLPDTGGFKIVR